MRSPASTQRELAAVAGDPLGIWLGGRWDRRWGRWGRPGLTNQSRAKESPDERLLTRAKVTPVRGGSDGVAQRGGCAGSGTEVLGMAGPEAEAPRQAYATRCTSKWSSTGRSGHAKVGAGLSRRHDHLPLPGQLQHPRQRTDSSLVGGPSKNQVRVPAALLAQNRARHAKPRHHHIPLRPRRRHVQQRPLVYLRLTQHDRGGRDASSATGWRDRSSSPTSSGTPLPILSTACSSTRPIAPAPGVPAPRSVRWRR